jgi:nucleotide-binding universal stress UspA family protein
VRYAAWLADKLDESLALVHVVEPSPRFAGREALVLVRNDLEVLELAQRHISRLADKLSKGDSIVRTFVRYGKPFNEIAALAADREANLIVVATHGHTGLKRVLLGSTAESVVRHAACPVLTIPSRAMDAQGGKAPALRLRKIVVPIDFSETSIQALPYAATLAERFGAEIILLHVFEPLPMPADAGYLAVGLEDVDPKAAQKHLRNLCQAVSGGDVPVQTLVRTGTPFREITETARSLGADMIVLTTHGYTGLMHVLLGSTAERIVRYADCPVLVVREPRPGGGKRTSSRPASRSRRTDR